MEIRICPECNKVFYALMDTESLVCYHCDFILFDCRGMSRHAADLNFTIKFLGHDVPAQLKDYSETGARIVYKGSLLSENTTLDLFIDELSIEAKAKTMWSKKIADNTYSYGLQFLK